MTAEHGSAVPAPLLIVPEVIPDRCHPVLICVAVGEPGKEMSLSPAGWRAISRRGHDPDRAPREERGA